MKQWDYAEFDDVLRRKFPRFLSTQQNKCNKEQVEISFCPACWVTF